MGNELYIALLNPAVSFVLAAAFYALWRLQRQYRYVAFMSFGYAAVGVGFLLQYFTLPVGSELSRLFSCTAFLAGSASIAGAMIGRSEMKVPVLALLALGGGGLAAFSWFMFVEPSLTWRILVVNFAIGGMTLVVAAELRRVLNRGIIEKVLFTLSILTGLNFFVRTLVIVGMHGPYETYEGFRQSLYWTTLVFSHMMFSVVMALTVIASTALRLIDQLRVESRSDALSGLLNRRGFEDQASKALQRCDRTGRPAALVVCDLDHFKLVNDTLGHAAGDRVIAAFSRHLHDAAGETCLIGRMGGEEFAVFLPDTEPTTARLFAEGVRVAFELMQIEGLPARARFSASFGVAEFEAGENLPILLSRADEALYQAKRAGRNRVRMAITPTEALQSIEHVRIAKESGSDVPGALTA